MEKYNVTGAVCSYEFEYHPPSTSPIPVSLHEGVGMIMGMGRYALLFPSRKRAILQSETTPIEIKHERTGK
jgi:hypothetical protein